MPASQPRPRNPDRQEPDIGVFRAQHLALGERALESEYGPSCVTVNEGESPLAWLARRRGRDGQALIAPHQLLAGERLRAEFTQAQMMPRTTSNWASPISTGRRGAGMGFPADTVIAARQRVRAALDDVGPEFAGLLLDVCCFLKKLEAVERERAWPLRSAKIVLQLALDRLARFYGYNGEARGHAYAALRTWLAEDAEFRVGA